MLPETPWNSVGKGGMPRALNFARCLDRRTASAQEITIAPGRPLNLPQHPQRPRPLGTVIRPLPADMGIPLFVNVILPVGLE